MPFWALWLFCERFAHDIVHQTFFLYYSGWSYEHTCIVVIIHTELLPQSSSFDPPPPHPWAGQCLLLPCHPQQKQWVLLSRRVWYWHLLCRTRQPKELSHSQGFFWDDVFTGNKIWHSIGITKPWQRHEHGNQSSCSCWCKRRIRRLPQLQQQG